MSNNIVLDSSALLALIQEGQGTEAIKPLLKFSIMSSVNVAESLTALRHVNITPQEALTFISDIVGSIIPFDVEQAMYVADIEPYVQRNGLSLGSQVCLALGIKLQIPIYTTNKAWTEFGLNNATIKLIH